MDQTEEKWATDLKWYVALKLAWMEFRNPFRFAGCFAGFLFSKWRGLPPKDFFTYYMAGRARRATKWRQKHADPVFGMPDEDYGWLGFTRWKFSAVPFRTARTSKVAVMTLGSPSQANRDTFLWIDRNIEELGALVPELLVEEAEAAGKTECYGEADPKRAAVAFAPENVFLVEFCEQDPAQWKIHTHHATDQDVCVTIQGHSEKVTRAFLSM